MRFFTAVCALACAAGVAARSPQHVGKTIPGYMEPRDRMARRNEYAAMQVRGQNTSETPSHLNSKTRPFHVDGANIPEVDFDIGESYAGLLPVGNDKSKELFFWYFPSKNPKASDEITIWLNGGPGCSSLEGFLQENGPFLWQYGTLKPVPNPWTWTNLTNMVWVEQPVGTGFTQGKPDAKSEEDVAREFLAFWKNFVNTFDLKGRKIYVTGESYAGMYVPHIAAAMLDKKDHDYYCLTGTMIYDPSINTDAIMNYVPAPGFVKFWEPLFALNQSFTDHINQVDQQCGLTSYVDKYLQYPPPKGPFPQPDDCGGKPSDLFNDITVAAAAINPCWDIYQVATTCPLLYDVLGFPGSFTYLPPGGEIYFNRRDVKKAINAPVNKHWYECSVENVFQTSTGLSTNANANRYSSFDVLPKVIDGSKRTIIAHGNLDMVLINTGSLLSIQNMTWGGKQGFQKKPSDTFYVPYHTEYQNTTLAGAGDFGVTHTERGLTWVDVHLTGHMQPQYAPSASFRHMEYLLGRIDSLSSTVPFEKSNQGYKAENDAPEKK